MATDETPLRILHLEDEPRDQELVRATLEAEGLACEIHAVSTRPDFVTTLERGEIDLILSDFALPGFDGLTALQIARQRRPDLPVIFLSGTIGEEAAIEAVKSGATDYVLKQRLARLVPAVRRAVTEAQAERRRREVEESLSREREFSTQLIESSVDGILAFDGELCITAWNAGMERITGRDRTEVLGRSALDLSLFRSETGGDAHLRDALAGRSTVAKDRPFSIAETGRQGFFDSYSSPLRDGSGAIVGGLAIVHDITGRRELEEQMRQAQKMEAVGRLAGGVAHDFNNLLTAILGYSQLLRLRLAGNPDVLSDVAEVEKAAHRATSLTRQLLAFSRQQVLNPKVLNLNGVIVDMDKMLRRLIGADIDLRTVPTAGLGNIKADAGQIEQVVMNLVVNARDAMPKGGKLTIETANRTLEGTQVGSLENLAAGRYVLLAVTDSGAGMAPDVKARIFEPFFTTKDVGHGTGLGLSTVHGIVKQSGAHIEVYSEIGHGTTFKIYFPRVEGQAEETGSGRSRAHGAGGREAILVIEDDELVRNVTVRALRGRGYHVAETDDRERALELFAAQPGGFALVLTDVVMPGMSLGEMVQRLRARSLDTRILYMSGYTDRAILHQERIGAAEAFLQKPFSIDDLLDKVREVLDEPPAAAA